MDRPVLIIEMPDLNYEQAAHIYPSPMKNPLRFSQILCIQRI